MQRRKARRGSQREFNKVITNAAIVNPAENNVGQIGNLPYKKMDKHEIAFI